MKFFISICFYVINLLNFRLCGLPAGLHLHLRGLLERQRRTEAAGGGGDECLGGPPRAIAHQFLAIFLRFSSFVRSFVRGRLQRFNPVGTVKQRHKRRGAR